MDQQYKVQKEHEIERKIMNDQDIKKDDHQDSLADLELAEEQADTAKAGLGTLASGGGGGAGKVSMRDW